MLIRVQRRIEPGEKLALLGGREQERGTDVPRRNGLTGRPADDHVDLGQPFGQRLQFIFGYIGQEDDRLIGLGRLSQGLQDRLTRRSDCAARRSRTWD